MAARTADARRGLLTAALAIATLATCLTGNATSAASALVPATASATQGASSANPPPSVSGSVPAGSYQITLVTGDRVALTVDAGGRSEATIEHWASWPGRSPEPKYQSFAGSDGVFVIPTEAQPAVDAGWLDRSLFDVAYLAANGLDDGRTQTLPVLVQYRRQSLPRGSARAVDTALLARAEAAPASTATAALSSIGGAALAVGKSQAATFWQSISAGPTARSVNAAEKVWLDRPVKVELDESVPLIGAPDAWAAGFDGAGVTVAVLDTGIDETHPDLQGTVVASKSFVGGTVKDGHGHGTHVAATVAGRGQRKGVAPKARLAIGKVLTDAGSGSVTGIIDGMEWATQEAGADVVSMSLGSGPSDGSDPGSLAVNALTASTGALFVIAAGNSGPTAATVSAPGAADAALTVAATDKQDQLASFSSRGPRMDGALKPDISAPGVAITAARAAGTTMGTPVDNLYTTASGTSMATPHVAGAAAIVKQQHPDWSPAMVKASLMSTSRDAGGASAYDQGAGRVDLTRAVAQRVVATTANLDFGTLPDNKPEPVSRQLEFGNASSEPVTLALTAALRKQDGSPVVSGPLSTDAEVTVPAGGTASATVTLHVDGLDRARYTGTVEATETASGIRLRTPVGLIVEQPKAMVTIRTLDRAGQPIGDLSLEHGGSLSGYAPYSSLMTALNVPGVASVDVVRVEPGVERVWIRPGSYTVRRDVRWWDDAAENYVDGLLFDAQVDVTGNTEVVLDARKAKPVTWTLPQSGTGPTYSYLTLDVGTADRGIFNSTGYGNYVTPTEKVTANLFRVGFKREEFRNTQVSMVVRRPQQAPVPLERHNSADLGLTMGGGGDGSVETSGGWVPFPAGRRTLQLVDVGFGDPRDLAGLDLQGKLALLRWGDDRSGQGLPTSVIWTDRIDNLQRAGAAGFVAFADPPGAAYVRHSSFSSPTNWFGHWSPAGPREIRIPELQVKRTVGKQLLALTGRGPVTVEVTSDPNVRYAYHAHVYRLQQIPDDMHIKLEDRDFARVDGRLHGALQPVRARMDVASWPVGNTFASSRFTWFAAPRAGLAEYFGPLDDQVLWTRRLGGGNNEFGATAEPRVFDRPTRIAEDWNIAPYTPGPVALRTILGGASGDAVLSKFVGCTMCRQGDSLIPWRGRVTGEGQYNEGLARSMRMFTDAGTEVPPTNRSGIPVYNLPPTAARYRATLAENGVDTTWRFTSARPAEDTNPEGSFCLGLLTGWPEPCSAQPLVYLSYDLSDIQKLDNTVAASPPAMRFGVRVSTGQSTGAMPAIAGMKLWTRVNGAGAWRPALVVPRAGYRGGERWFDVLSLHGGKAGAKISLKAEAWDAAGNRIEQVVNDAVTLS
jgi:subtilisin family serine protease